MTQWNTQETGFNSNILSREDATNRILELAREKGISGSFKVYYDGQLIASPSQLPEQVDMTRIEINPSIVGA